VEVDNAIAHGPPEPGDPAAAGGSLLAARAYVRRAHSGPYGLVNSEEGFGNLSRFLFGDLRVDGDLLVREVELPPGLLAEKARQQAAGRDAAIRASYNFEASLRIRGERWVLTERSARDGSAIFRRYDELFANAKLAPELKDTEKLRQDRERHQRIELFSAFLDTGLRTLDGKPETVQDKELHGTLGFALRLRAAVPDYEVDGGFWRTNHYEGSALLDRDLVFLAYEDSTLPGGWGLAFGPNTAGDLNAGMRLITATTQDEPGAVADMAWFRPLPDSVEFWIPVQQGEAPAFRAWLRLTARRWNRN
jgi:hypothetical protein